MCEEEIKIRLNEIEFHILKNPTADFVELTRIIFERIEKLRILLKNNNAYLCLMLINIRIFFCIDNTHLYYFIVLNIKYMSRVVIMSIFY